MRTTEFRAELKKNSLVFFTYQKLTDELYRSGYIDFLLKKQIKSTHSIRKELALMEDYWKCDPMNYYRYRLYEKNISREELLDYIPSYYFYNYYVPSIYSYAKVREGESKILMNSYLTSKQVRVPFSIAVTINGKIYADGNVIGYDSLLRKLKDSDSKVFFMKPEMGKGGIGIFKIEKIGREFFINNEFMSDDYFTEITGRQNYIIQEGVIQRDDVMKVYPLSVNTLRILTHSLNGKPVISAAMFRMGRRGTFVDNACSGGISMGVDLDTGKIAGHAIDLENNRKFDRHPDTGFRFEGFVIEGWDEIKRQVLDFAAKTPDFPDKGWDIAITKDGITAIEINLRYGIDIQGIVGGLRTRMNIVPYESPKKYSVNHE